MSPIEYERVRVGEAKRLRCRLSVLDREVRKLRGSSGDELAGSFRGRPLELRDPEPWPGDVRLGAVLGDLVTEIERHCVISGHAAEAVALWVAMTFVMEHVTIAPRLMIISPEKRCGKTTLLDLIHEAVPRPLTASGITPAAVFRAIEAAHPTLLMDEADTFIRESGEWKGLLNSGHRRNTAILIRAVGRDHEPRSFSTWAAIAFALVGKLHDMIMDRSVVIEMRRKLPREQVEPLDDVSRERIRIVARKLAGWSSEHGHEVAGSPAH